MSYRRGFPVAALSIQSRPRAEPAPVGDIGNIAKSD
jgi:hypothetical protein